MESAIFYHTCQWSTPALPREVWIGYTSSTIGWFNVLTTCRGTQDVPGVVETNPGVRSCMIEYDQRCLPLQELIKILTTAESELSTVSCSNTDHGLPHNSIWLSGKLMHCPATAKAEPFLTHWKYLGPGPFVPDSGLPINGCTVTDNTAEMQCT